MKRIYFSEQEFKDRLTGLIKTHFENDKKFAEALNISLATANRWRNQKLTPRIELLAKLSILTNVSLDYIILGKES